MLPPPPLLPPPPTSPGSSHRLRKRLIRLGIRNQALITNLVAIGIRFIFIDEAMFTKFIKGTITVNFFNLIFICIIRRHISKLDELNIKYIYNYLMVVFLNSINFFPSIFILNLGCIYYNHLSSLCSIKSSSNVGEHVKSCTYKSHFASFMKD